MSNKKYIFFFDIDGTLVDSSYIVHPRVTGAIKTARSRGHKIFVNTGRAPGFVPKKLFAQIETDGCVCGLGSTVIINNKVVSRDCFTAKNVVNTYNFAKARGLNCFVESEGAVFVVHTPESGIWGIDGEIRDLSEAFASPEIALVSKIDVAGTLSEDDRAEFERLLGGIYFLQHQYYCEMSPPGNSKSGGIRKVVDYYAGRGEGYETVAVGDSGNDIDMIKYADIGVAVGNALPEVKEIADITVCSVEDGGAGEAIEKIIGL